jgi:Xaa-Pro aminopeptidase
MSDFRYPHRITRLRELLPTTDAPVAAMLVTQIENVRYLTGFSGSNGVVIVTADKAIFITDGRYKLQAATEVTGFEQVIPPVGTRMEDVNVETIKGIGVKTVGIESGSMVVNSYERLNKGFEGNVTLISRSDILDTLRRIKDAEEIAATRRAIAAADACFAFIQQVLKPGMREVDLAWEIEVFLRRGQGASKLAFDTIVGSGPNSALIHGHPGERVIGSSGETEFLLCDYGCELDGYNSDITRTFFVGGEPTARQKEIYDAVLRAELTSIEAIKPGANGKDIDKIARDILTEAGLGETFAHSLGHGLGRVVHDHPALGPTSELVLQAGMVLTVEPGAYIADFGGVRIEDDVLVTETGYEILTQSSRSPIVLLR